MTQDDKIKFISYISLRDELDSVQGQGTNLYLGKYRTSADCIASVCVFSEDTNYMRDYVSGSLGNADSLIFDKL